MSFFKVIVCRFVSLLSVVILVGCGEAPSGTYSCGSDIYRFTSSTVSGPIAMRDQELPYSMKGGEVRVQLRPGASIGMFVFKGGKLYQVVTSLEECQRR